MVGVVYNGKAARIDNVTFDMNKIKLKLVQSIRAFNSGVRSRNRGAETEKGPEHFNAAEYLFVSTRLAKDKEWSEPREAQIIALFRTPWPKQSYQREADVSQTYSRKYTELYRSVSIIAIFFLTNLLQIPPAFQDMVIQMCTTATVGYTVLLHIDLYDVFPVLVIVPCIVIGTMVYVIIHYNAKRARRKLEQTFPFDPALDLADDELLDGGTTRRITSKEGEKEANFEGDEENGDESTRKKALLGAESGQEGELHLPRAAPPPGPLTAPVGHTTRKQSVMHGLNVLNVLQEPQRESESAWAVVNVTSSVEGEDSDESDAGEGENNDRAQEQQHPAVEKEATTSCEENSAVLQSSPSNVDPLAINSDAVKEKLPAEIAPAQASLSSEPSKRLKSSFSLHSLTPSEEEAFCESFSSDGEDDWESEHDKKMKMGEEGHGQVEENPTTQQINAEEKGKEANEEKSREGKVEKEKEEKRAVGDGSVSGVGDVVSFTHEKSSAGTGSAGIATSDAEVEESGSESEAESDTSYFGSLVLSDESVYM